MVAINQRIPNFLGGVSQQPDTIKFPGQVRTCDNFVPDVTFGLQKRPSGEFVGKLANANNTGYWYEILRDGDEKYLVQITPANSGSMPIRVWDLANGTEKSLTNSSGDSIFSYLAQTGTTEKYAIQTIQDYTLIANPKVTAKRNNTLAGGLLDNGDYAFVRLDTIAYNTEYVFHISQPPTPNTYYRVTALSVTKTSGSPSGNTETGNTWDDTNKDGRYSGLAQFAFTDSECENIEGHVTVNAANYVDSNQANYQADDASGTPSTSGTGADFIGYTQVYKTRYTAQVTLKDGGLIKNTSESNALAKSQAVTIEGVTYTINVDAVEPVETYEGIGGIAFYKTPRNPDEGSLSMSKILQGLKASLSNISNCTGTIIGSGMYLSGSNAPNINFLGGAVNEQMSVIGRTVDDISRLPAQCKHGYIAQVSNTDNSEADNYYVKFIADSGSIGSGRWEECARPDLFDGETTGGMYNNVFTDSTTFRYVLTNHPFSVGEERYFDFTLGTLIDKDGVYTCTEVTDANNTVWEHGFTGLSGSGNITSHANPEMTGFDASTMPHALVNNRDNTFTFKKLDLTTANTDGTDNYWKTREVGDVTTNPFPSIQDKKIQKIFFHRNRLGLIADEQVLLSRPGDYFNLFVVSAITTSDDNPIDITVSDIKPAFINHILPVQKGVMMFSDNGQFLLFTESDIFSPKTARLKKISSYETDADIQPLDMGTSIMFTSKLSAHTRAFEATVLDDDIPPKILEQTRVVPEFVPKDITTSTNSANLGMVTFAKTGDNNKKLYHYKYYDSGDRRDQSAWYTWTLSHVMYHMFYTEGCLYTVIKHDSDYMLNRHEFVADHESLLRDIDAGEDGLARKLPVCLDNATGVGSGEMNYSTSTGKTTVTLPYTPTGVLSGGLPYIVITSGNIPSVPSDGTGNHASRGLVIQAESVSTNAAVFNEKLTGSWMGAIVGYKYTSTLELPTYYPVLGENQFDVNGDLRISGMNFELGVASPMEFHLESIYSDIDDYIHEYTAIESDTEDTFGSTPVKVQQSLRIPIQRKNKKYNLTIKSIEAFPMSLISASWDGIYNQRRHVRR